LCSSTGIPHSTQIRMRFLGPALLNPNIFLRMDISASRPIGATPLPTDTSDVPDWFPRRSATLGAPGQGLDWSRARANLSGTAPVKRREENQPADTSRTTSCLHPRDAIEVFTLNVEDHPDSFNAHDSLGEAYAAHGDRELAIKHYQRSIELNPDNTNGIEALKKLRGGPEH